MSVGHFNLPSFTMSEKESDYEADAEVEAAEARFAEVIQKKLTRQPPVPSSEARNQGM